MNAEQAKEAEAKLAEFDAYVRGRFPDQVEMVYDHAGKVSFTAHPVISLAATGEPYTELPILEHRTRALPKNIDDAVAQMRRAFDDYADGKCGTLYWRVKPEVEFYKGRGWMFYLRLLISDKPPLKKED